MEGEAATTEPGRSHPLLWAIVEFREQIDRLIEEQKALVLSRAAEPVAPEPAPPKPEPIVPEAPTAPEPVPRAARAFSASAPRTRPVDNPPQSVPVVEPAELSTPEPARPDDARQRLDALAAKLLDRHRKHAAADPSARQGEG